MLQWGRRVSAIKQAHWAPLGSVQLSYSKYLNVRYTPTTKIIYAIDTRILCADFEAKFFGKWMPQSHVHSFLCIWAWIHTHIWNITNTTFTHVHTSTPYTAYMCDIDIEVCVSIYPCKCIIFNLLYTVCTPDKHTQTQLLAYVCFNQKLVPVVFLLWVRVQLIAAPVLRKPIDYPIPNRIQAILKLLVWSSLCCDSLLASKKRSLSEALTHRSA